MSAQQLFKFFSQSSPTVQSLRKHAEQLLALQSLWERVAPPGIAGSVKVGALDNNNLLLFANNGALAAKIKQQIPHLLTKFHEQGFDLTSISVRVQVNYGTETRMPVSKRTLPNAAIEQIEALENTLEDSPLRQALRKLRSAGQHSKVRNRDL